jgi:hypothetical protein
LLLRPFPFLARCRLISGIPYRWQRRLPVSVPDEGSENAVDGAAVLDKCEIFCFCNVIGHSDR